MEGGMLRPENGWEFEPCCRGATSGLNPFSRSLMGDASGEYPTASQRGDWSSYGRESRADVFESTLVSTVTAEDRRRRQDVQRELGVEVEKGRRRGGG
jgi:hypothetical protein